MLEHKKDSMVFYFIKLTSSNTISSSFLEAKHKGIVKYKIILTTEPTNNTAPAVPMTIIYGGILMGGSVLIIGECEEISDIGIFVGCLRIGAGDGFLGGE